MTIEDTINKLILHDILEHQQKKEENTKNMQIITIHTSKDLEFPSIYIIDFEKEILPHHSNIETDTIKKEQRLTYVDITRTKHNLTLS